VLFVLAVGPQDDGDLPRVMQERVQAGGLGVEKARSLGFFAGLVLLMMLALWVWGAGVPARGGTVGGAPAGRRA
jgi:hypothetical protein